MNQLATKQEPSAPALQQEQASFLAMIERVAANPDADIDKLERLLDMQERVANAHKQQAFNAAMARMQIDLPTIERSGVIAVGGQVRSKYARYEDIMRAIKPALTANGFAVTFQTKNEGNAIEVTGVLMHAEGWREQTSMTLPYDNSGSKNVVQSIGSSTSYGKRYVLCSLLNIATGDEDDDGQLASLDSLAEIERSIMMCTTAEELRSFFGQAYRSLKNKGDKDRIEHAYKIKKQEFEQ